MTENSPRSSSSKSGPCALGDPFLISSPPPSYGVMPSQPVCVLLLRRSSSSFIWGGWFWVVHVSECNRILLPSRPGSLILDPRSRILDPGPRILDPGSRTLDPGSRIQVPGSWILHPGSGTISGTTLVAYIRVRGFPLNGIFGPCACLLAGGCGAWRLLARRRRRRRHSVPVPLGEP